MSFGAWAPAAAGTLIAVAAVIGLWRSGHRYPGPDWHAWRWFAVTAACWAAGLVLRQAAPGWAAGGAFTVADVPSLLALAALVAGLRELAFSSPGAAGEPPVAGAWLGPGGLATRLADGYVLAAALFLIGWVTLLGADYARWDEAAGTFTLELIHPLTAALVLGWVLSLAVAAGRRAAAPCLALLAVAAADALDVAARVSGRQAGLAAQLLVVAALVLLALVPVAWPVPARWLPWLRLTGRGGAERPGGQRPAVVAGRWATAMLAAVAAVAAALAVIVWALLGSPGFQPVVALVGGSAALVLAARALGLAWQQRDRAASWLQASRQFRELAERTSDAVLVCDRDGVIRYASPAVADYGYSPAALPGVRLADLLHPEDRRGGSQAARDAADGQQPVRFGCRVRAVDGTWRHVQASLSRYREPGGPDGLLVTARDISDQVALRRRVTHLTFHDGLTGLPNRAYIEERARAALGTGGQPPAGRADGAAAGGTTGNGAGMGGAAAGGAAAVGTPAGGAAAAAVGGAAVAGIILLDLDGFTAVNDSAGHSAADLILSQAARRLRAALPPDHTVARWGGDEFAVLIEGGLAAREIAELAHRLAGSIASSAFRVGDRQLSLTASVGVALADGSPPGYLWRNADLAMLRAKDAGGGQVEVYAGAAGLAGGPRFALASEIQRALAEGALSLSYQPVTELATRRVVSAIANVRLARGGPSTAELLTAAEVSGLIVPLGEWVLRQACAEAAQWREAGLDAGVWVRVSPAQAVAPRFAESVLGALSAAGLPAAALTLEAAERDLVDDGGTAMPGLAEVRGHGVRLAVGDFGTDYASLSHLRRRRVDVVTLAGEFVAGLTADAELAKLTEAIVRVGSGLGIEVVAAGISQPGQLTLLRAMGCGLGQGELVAPEAAARDLAALAAPAPAVSAAVPAAPAAAPPAGPAASAPAAPPAGPPGSVPAAPPASAPAGPPVSETPIPHAETKLLSS
jgi:diguanylate cyclase (GGDEF)-like protein/PAS domain S-box-containing protein